MLKKFLVKGAIALAILFAVLFAVQLVDNALHKDDYAKIDAALKELARVEKRHGDCYSMFYLGIDQVVNNDVARIEKLLKDKERLNTLQASCFAAADEVRALNVEDVKFESKKRQFKDFQKLNEQLYHNSGLVFGVWKNCSAYDESCKKKENAVVLEPVSLNFFLLYYDKLANVRFRPSYRAVAATLPDKIAVWYCRNFIVTNNITENKK